ncbi:MAG: hypothetical protein LBE12_10880 [Planctomycetaceae bacterium]|jgi:hypothetical protein|nr:hypothetical protein [Planctomycetaceae bacterium]
MKTIQKKIFYLLSAGLLLMVCNINFWDMGYSGMVANGQEVLSVSSVPKENTEKVNFDYAFGAPHRITFSRPSASEKILATIQKENLDLKWTWQNLKDKHPLSWTIMPMDIILDFRLYLDGEALPFNSWKRTESGAPMLAAAGSRNGTSFNLQAIAATGGVVMKIEIFNKEQNPHSLQAVLTHKNGWVISNQGWIDEVNSDVLMTMNQGRADRLIAIGKGADFYPIVRDGKAVAGGVPMSNVEYENKGGNSRKSMISVFEVSGGGVKTGYWFLPYNSYFEDTTGLRAADWETMMNTAKKEYDDLLSSGTEFIIPDKDVIHCYRSCLADLFVMREELANGYTGVSPGTEVYRSPNSSEGVLSCHAFDRLGYSAEAISDMRVFFEGQDDSGCWSYSKGWEHDGWSVCYFKAMLALEHYRITGDREFLRNIYKRMKASSIFNHHARQKSKGVRDSPFYGLMPRGMGDCGLMNGSDYYGVFYPTNCLSAAADGLTLEAAKILELTEDIKLLEEIYQDAKTDLVNSIRNNAQNDNGVPYIPGIAGASNASLFGCLYAFYPAHLLEKEDPLIQGTLHLIESKKMSEGGLPVGTGWMKDGLWVAMALDNIASTYLRMDRFDKASKYFYPVLNHASPLVTWCEERGVAKGTTEKSGDLQHCWTPVSVCHFLREMMILEDTSVLHIAAASPRKWLETGLEIGVKKARSWYGILDFSITRTKENRIEIAFSCERPLDVETIFHIRLPLENYKLKIEKCTISGVRVENETVILPKGVHKEISLVLEL